MNIRSGIAVTAVVSIALAACSVEPAAVPAPGPFVPQSVNVQAAAPAPAAGQDYQSLHQGFLSRASGAAAAAVTTDAPAGWEYQSLYGTYRVLVRSAPPAAGQDYQSLHQGFLSRASGAAAAAVTTDAPAEDFQSLHATYLHLQR